MPHPDIDISLDTDPRTFIERIAQVANELPGYEVNYSPSNDRGVAILPRPNTTPGGGDGHIMVDPSDNNKITVTVLNGDIDPWKTTKSEYNRAAHAIFDPVLEEYNERFGSEIEVTVS